MHAIICLPTLLVSQSRAFAARQRPKHSLTPATIASERGVFHQPVALRANFCSCAVPLLFALHWWVCAFFEFNVIWLVAFVVYLQTIRIGFLTFRRLSIVRSTSAINFNIHYQIHLLLALAKNTHTYTHTLTHNQTNNRTHAYIHTYARIADALRCSAICSCTALRVNARLITIGILSSIELMICHVCMFELN